MRSAARRRYRVAFKKADVIRDEFHPTYVTLDEAALKFNKSISAITQWYKKEYLDLKGCKMLGVILLEPESVKRIVMTQQNDFNRIYEQKDIKLHYKVNANRIAHISKRYDVKRKKYGRNFKYDGDSWDAAYLEWQKWRNKPRGNT